MVKEIEWDGDNQLSYEVVQNIEKLWNVKFPKIYVDIVTKHDGAQPEVKDEDDEWKDGSIKIPKWPNGSTYISFIRYTK